MNRFILSILIFLFSVHLYGQLFPISDYYINNELAINPSYAGCQDALSATILYRNQWVGFKDAPKSQVLSVHTPLDNDRIGLGMLIENYSTGIFSETSFIGNYAYRRELYNGKLSLGLGFGFTFYRNAWNDLDASDADDIQLMDNPASAILPTFSVGAYYYTKKYFIGISLPRFLSHETDHNSGKYKIRNDFSEYNYVFTGGYELDLSSQIKLLPSMLIKYHPNTAMQIDYTARINYRDRICAGIGYRSRNTLIGMFQCKINDQLTIAYSYDFDSGSLGRYKSGSHELVLNYIFSYTRKVTGPRQF